jgi:membrane peptidoglycan carboxypeptidase
LSVLKVVSPRTWAKLLSLSLILVVAYAVIGIIGSEFQSSRFQASYLAEVAHELKFRVGPGPSPSIRFPQSGPYDERLGYSQIAAFVKRLTARDYVVAEQARVSARLIELTDLGLFPAYREKTQAGLSLLDHNNRPLYSVRFPERVYDRFESVPALLVDTLLFIENRELLDAQHPMRNPAVEWDRFSRAMLDQVLHLVNKNHETPGGSTLATQIEKYRHSPGGRTRSPKEKLRQMVSASLRAYLNGKNTLAARRQIVVDYLNTVPLSAKPGYGEIDGMGDGLWAWYGRDFEEVNKLLKDDAGADRPPGKRLERKAESFKQALSLMIAQRLPSYFLGDGAGSLEHLTNSHLRLLGAAGIIPPALRDVALRARLTLRQGAAEPLPASFATQKAANALRTHLAGLLGVPRLYDLDRLDLTVSSTLNASVQLSVTQVLRRLSDPKVAREQGLYGFRMLSDGDDPGKLTFSFTLFERGEQANLLRVQADNFDQPFDINEGAKLNLGSTAKLRTLITYLEIVADLHRRYGGMSATELAAVHVEPRDALTRWALDYLTQVPEGNLRAMLDAAMEQRYSGSPAEAFFTGGGMQTFTNFEPEEDYQTFTVRGGFQHSVNLVFVRLMRDIVRHYLYQTPVSTAKLLEDAADPLRREYLSRFADREGREFISRFYRKYQGKTAREAQDLLLQGVRPLPRRLATIFRSIEPQAGFDQFSAFLREQLPGELSEPTLRKVYEKYGPDKFSLVDRGYLAGVHPLELWLVAFLSQHPGATRSQAVEASRTERQAVYRWLFMTRHKNVQDKRIQSLLEVEAFLEIGRAWRRLGYPFEALTPSYATAIGASGDRPAALTELMGIIVKRGLQLPVARVETLHFATATPYETRLEYTPAKPQRVLPEEIADVVRRSLIDVVEGGTAKRLAGGFRLRNGGSMEIGGKTGTGDHRYAVYGRAGRLISSRVVNRSATFVFLIGDRYFGTITAYVHEPYAARYKFTSALAVKLLKSLAPALMPLAEEKTVHRQVAGSG